MNSYADQVVLVTGGTGFIGSHLVKRLLLDGAKVSVLLRDIHKPGNLFKYRDQIHFIEADLRSLQKKDLDSLQPEYVFHLAAAGIESPLGNYIEMLETNAIGTGNLLTCLEDNSILKNFVYTGTDFEYGQNEGNVSEKQTLNPANHYAASKSAGWMVCRDFVNSRKMKVTGVRLFYTYGPGQSENRFISAVVRKAVNLEKEFRMTNGEQVRDFIFVEDVVNGILSAGKAPQAIGQMINLGTGVGTSLRSVVELILEMVGSDMKPIFGAMPYRDGEIFHLVSDSSLAKRILGWNSLYNLQTGLEVTINWYKHQLTKL